MPAFAILGLVLILAVQAPVQPATPASAPALEQTPDKPEDAVDQEVALEEGGEDDFFEEGETEDEEVALEEGSEGDFFEEGETEEEEVVFADDGEATLAQTDAPAFGAAFPEHDPRRWLLLLPLALLALFTLNVRWRTPSK